LPTAKACLAPGKSKNAAMKIYPSCLSRK
jgi:hypothetical protein